MEKNQELVFFGKNNVIEIIKTKEISKIFVLKKYKGEMRSLVKKKNIPFVVVDKYYLDKLTNNASHQGIVAIAAPVDYVEFDNLIEKNSNVKNPCIVMLDELQDANNLGAILRSVDCFGLNGVIFNKKRNIQLTETVSKISAGAINHVDVCRVTNLSNAIKSLKKKGYWIVYLDMDGEHSLHEVDLDMPIVVVIGGEDKGVTDNIKKNCDFGITIPMYGHLNSLNAAMATSIFAYQKSANKNE